MKFTSTKTVVTTTEHEFIPLFGVLENGNLYSTFQFAWDAERFVEKMREVESDLDVFEVIRLETPGDEPLAEWERELLAGSKPEPTEPDEDEEGTCGCAWCRDERD